jgi:hypothetical protein
LKIRELQATFNSPYLVFRVWCFVSGIDHHISVLHHKTAKKLLESDYPGREAPALLPIHGFATAIAKAFFRQTLLTLTWPRPPGFPKRTEHSRKKIAFPTSYETVNSQFSIFNSQ